MAAPINRNPLVTPFMSDKALEREARRLARIAAGERGLVRTPFERERVGLDVLGSQFGQILQQQADASARNLALLSGSGGGYGGGVLQGAATAAQQEAQIAPTAAATFVAGRRAESERKQTEAEREYDKSIGMYTSDFLDKLKTRELEKAASIAELEATSEALDFKYKSLQSEEARFYAKLKQDAELAREQMAADAAKGTLTRAEVLKEINDFVDSRVKSSTTTSVPKGFTGSIVFKYRPTAAEIASGIATDSKGLAISDPVNYDWTDINNLTEKVKATYPNFVPGTISIQTREAVEGEQKVYDYSIPALKKQAMSIGLASGLPANIVRQIVNQAFAGINRT